MIIVNQTSPNNTRKREEKKTHRSQLGLMFHGSLKKGDETGPILWFPLFSHSWWNSIRRPRSLCVAPGIKRERGLLFICDGWSHPVFIVSQTQIHSGWNLCLKNVCVAALMLLSYLYLFIYCFFFLFLNTFSCFQWRWIRFKIWKDELFQLLFSFEIKEFGLFIDRRNGFKRTKHSIDRFLKKKRAVSVF